LRTSYWDFGDGTTSTAQNPTHQYADDGTYTVTLTVTDDDGASDSASRSITVLNVGPTADFSYSPSEPKAGENVTFDASSSYDPDGAIVSYHWDFGDGETGTGKTATHSYADDGTYTVTLTVTDDDGASDSASRTVIVSGTFSSATSPNQPPTADFSYSPSSPTTADTVQFWDFGDGTTSTAQNPTHQYADDGTYTVTLTVTDDDGASDTATATVIVSSVTIQSYTLTVEASGPGSILVDPPGESVRGTVTFTFPGSTEVTLTATPDSGAHFGGWTEGRPEGVDPLVATLTIVVDSDVRVAGTFAEDPGDAVLTVVVSGNGRVDITPLGDTTYTTYTSISISFSRSFDYDYAYDYEGGSPSGPVSGTATFDEFRGERFTESGDGYNVEYVFSGLVYRIVGTEVALEAIPDPGFTFVEWRDGSGASIGSSATSAVIMTSDKYRESVFGELPFLTVRAVEYGDADHAIEDAGIEVTGPASYAVAGSDTRQVDPGDYTVEFDPKTPSGWALSSVTLPDGTEQDSARASVQLHPGEAKAVIGRYKPLLTVRAVEYGNPDHVIPDVQILVVGSDSYQVQGSGSLPVYGSYSVTFDKSVASGWKLHHIEVQPDGTTTEDSSVTVNMTKESKAAVGFYYKAALRVVAVRCGHPDDVFSDATIAVDRYGTRTIENYIYSGTRYDQEYYYKVVSSSNFVSYIYSGTRYDQEYYYKVVSYYYGGSSTDYIWSDVYYGETYSQSSGGAGVTYSGRGPTARTKERASRRTTTGTAGRTGTTSGSSRRRRPRRARTTFGAMSTTGRRTPCPPVIGA